MLKTYQFKTHCKVEHSDSRFESIRIDSYPESIRIDSICKIIGISIHNHRVLYNE